MCNEWIEELYSIIHDSISTLHPYGGSSGAGLIFTGSYDWHSCVHAHWANNAIDEYFHRDAALSSRLTHFNLEAEFNYLVENPNFESPYGRSWFLLLLEQMNKSDLESVRLALSKEMFDWLKNSPFPEKETIIGTHNSWLFTAFILRLSKTLNGSESDVLDKLIMNRLAPFVETLECYDHNSGGITWDFIDRSCLYATIKLLQGHVLTEAHSNNLARIRDEFLETSYEDLGRPEAHIPGRLVMISWPFALFDADSHQKMLAKIKDHKYFYAGDFHCFSHWIPQFIWMSYFLQNIRVFSR